MAVIQFHLNLSKHKKSLVTILNVYAPTSQRVQQHPEEATEFYDQLGPRIEEYSRKSAMFFIGGDLNSKLGTKSSPAASSLGNYGKGKRNNNEMEISWPTSSLPITFVLPTRSSVTNSVIDPPGVQI
jgi:exonuclease III